MHEDKIIQKLGEHEELLREVATKTELYEFRREVLMAQDGILTIVRRLVL